MIHRFCRMLQACNLPRLLTGAGALLLLAGLLFAVAPPAPPQAFPVPAVQGAPELPILPAPLPEPYPPPEEQALPAGQLLITPARQAYQSGQLRLIIPQLGINQPVEAGVTQAHLQAGPGLYDYAQLPGEEGGNVSIAGHRDIHGAIFYYIDRLAPGHQLYLVYNGSIYIYAYDTTSIVAANDWEPIYSKGFSCLTLTSCDPIGTSRNRIIVNARLTGTAPYSEDYPFS